MFQNQSDLKTYISLIEDVMLADKSKIATSGQGSVALVNGNTQLMLSNCLHSRTLVYNLLGFSYLSKRGFQFNCLGNDVFEVTEDSREMMGGVIHNRVFVSNISIGKHLPQTSSA